MKRAIIFASLLTVAAMGTGLAVEPAFSEPTSHTLAFVSSDLGSEQTPPNHLVQASTIQVSGETVGFAASMCTLHVSTTLLTCDIAAASVPGMLYAHVSIDTQSGMVTGIVTGGTHAYKGATGTVAGQPGTQSGETDITIVYHT